MCGARVNYVGGAAGGEPLGTRVPPPLGTGAGTEPLGDGAGVWQRFTHSSTAFLHCAWHWGFPSQLSMQSVNWSWHSVLQA